MNETVRGLVLLFSVVLWLPFLRPTLNGSLPLEQGVLWYGVTLLLAWAGGAGLAALFRGYALQSEPSDETRRGEGAEHPQSGELRRRAEDRSE